MLIYFNHKAILLERGKCIAYPNFNQAFNLEKISKKGVIYLKNKILKIV